MMSEQTYSGKDLDAIFGPGAAAHAAQVVQDGATFGGDLASKNIAGVIADAPAVVKDAVGALKTFYHLYVCRFADCVAAANPKAGSLHQRGVHLASSTPRTDVKCPGCGKPMVIARDGLDAKGNSIPQITEDGDGNAVFHGQPIIQEAPGQPDQTAEIEKENAA
jgi:hypothetical protein